jgi:ceramide glucosyltransferase
MRGGLVTGALALLAAGSAVLQLVLIVGGVLARRRALRRYAARPPRLLPELSVVVLVPIRGTCEGLVQSLDSICGQSPVAHDVVAITETPHEPAADLVRSLQSRHLRLRHVAAGRARFCCQKNHNLLAGIQAFPDCDVYVTADVGILPPADWLARLVEPFADLKVQVTSNHQWILAPERRPSDRGSLILASIHAYLHAAARCPGLVSAWGGSTAVRRTALLGGGLAAAWSRAVGDDVVTSAWARRSKRKIVYLPGNLVYMVPDPLPAGELWRWLVRQCQLQFYNNRVAWLALIVCHAATFVTLAAAPPLVTLMVLGIGPTALALSLGGCLGLLAAGAAGMRLNEPGERRSFGAWLVAGMTLMAISFPALLTASLKRHIDWSGIRYRMSRSGEVLAVERSEEANFAAPVPADRQACL